jgi:hypothetical protein
MRVLLDALTEHAVEHVRFDFVTDENLHASGGSRRRIA